MLCLGDKERSQLGALSQWAEANGKSGLDCRDCSTLFLYLTILDDGTRGEVAVFAASFQPS